MKSLCALLSWTYFLFKFWYQTYKTISNQFKGWRKVNISIDFPPSLKLVWNSFISWYRNVNKKYVQFNIATAALKQYQFFTIYIFTCYINFGWTHCFCLIYCQSSYWLLLLFNTITFLDRWMKCCSFAFVCSKWNCCKTTF